MSIVSTTAGICFVLGKSVDRLTLGEWKYHARNACSNAFRSNPRIKSSLPPENEKLDVRKYFDDRPIGRIQTTAIMGTSLSIDEAFEFRKSFIVWITELQDNLSPGS
ncbi:hypothetical protein [Paraburkholderia terrae]|uniref:hypothetical protein n=1 Tax=Paraburkholderia terrae TaxID=311230 RepID=UPI0033653D2C